eukprot:gnl/TRDRNA2_/TRDRNA2_144838_c0_seq1.p1 gnl/TRDRNA2_/TRDRNA2_144838_c0~~gnl/TRDRNA2_/TRDRNA2_144838_c0_seq1.p1  ORF type:complete len:1051 (-),score=162.56 gnl/TRDRNA2_/TRDRNA2_144838_c0_seq1:63-3215(-)
MSVSGEGRHTPASSRMSPSPSLCMSDGRSGVASLQRKLKAAALRPLRPRGFSQQRRDKLKHQILAEQDKTYIDGFSQVLWQGEEVAFAAEAKAKTLELRRRTVELLNKADLCDMAADSMENDDEEALRNRRVTYMPDEDKELASICEVANLPHEGRETRAAASRDSCLESAKSYLKKHARMQKDDGKRSTLKEGFFDSTLKEVKEIADGLQWLATHRDRSAGRSACNSRRGSTEDDNRPSVENEAVLSSGAPPDCARVEDNGHVAESGARVPPGSTLPSPKDNDEQSIDEDKDVDSRRSSIVSAAGKIGANPGTTPRFTLSVSQAASKYDLPTARPESRLSRCSTADDADAQTVAAKDTPLASSLSVPAEVSEEQQGDTDRPRSSLKKRKSTFAKGRSNSKSFGGGLKGFRRRTRQSQGESAVAETLMTGVPAQEEGGQDVKNEYDGEVWSPETVNTGEDGDDNNGDDPGIEIEKGDGEVLPGANKRASAPSVVTPHMAPMAVTNQSSARRSLPSTGRPSRRSLSYRRSVSSLNTSSKRSFQSERDSADSPASPKTPKEGSRLSWDKEPTSPKLQRSGSLHEKSSKPNSFSIWPSLNSTKRASAKGGDSSDPSSPRSTGPRAPNDSQRRQGNRTIVDDVPPILVDKSGAQKPRTGRQRGASFSIWPDIPDSKKNSLPAVAAEGENEGKRVTLVPAGVPTPEAIGEGHSMSTLPDAAHTAEGAPRRNSEGTTKHRKNSGSRPHSPAHYDYYGSGVEHLQLLLRENRVVEGAPKEATVSITRDTVSGAVTIEASWEPPGQPKRRSVVEGGSRATDGPSGLADQKAQRHFDAEAFHEIFKWGNVMHLNAFGRLGWLAGLIEIEEDKERSLHKLKLKDYDEAHGYGKKPPKHFSRMDSGMRGSLKGNFHVSQHQVVEQNEQTVKIQTISESTDDKRKKQSVDTVSKRFGVTELVTEILYDMFSHLDRSKDGTIDAGEFKVMIKQVSNFFQRRPLEDAEITRVWRGLGCTSAAAGSVQFTEFMSWLVAAYPIIKNMSRWEAHKFAQAVCNKDDGT